MTFKNLFSFDKKICNFPKKQRFATYGKKDIFF